MDLTRTLRRNRLRTQPILGIVLAATLLAAIPLLQSCNLFENQTTASQPEKARKTMEPVRNNIAPQIMIPPIDAAAPIHVETATFALG